MQRLVLIWFWKIRTRTKLNQNNSRGKAAIGKQQNAQCAEEHSSDIDTSSKTPPNCNSDKFPIDILWKYILVSWLMVIQQNAQCRRTSSVQILILFLSPPKTQLNATLTNFQQRYYGNTFRYTSWLFSNGQIGSCIVTICEQF